MMCVVDVNLSFESILQEKIKRYFIKITYLFGQMYFQQNLLLHLNIEIN